MQRTDTQPSMPQLPAPQTRRFVYRSADTDAAPVHPLRRRADAHAASARLLPALAMIQFRVYLRTK